MAVDLSNVELPPFEVEITNQTLVRVGVAVILVAAIIMMLGRNLKKL